MKDVIVTSNGKTIVPTVWENAAASNPLVSHAVMVGEGRSYLSALLLLYPEEVAAWAHNAGIEIGMASGTGFDEITDAHLRAQLQGTIDTTLVTPTMKIKRRIVLERGALVVDNLYR